MQHVYKRGKTYYIRLAVPGDLRAYILFREFTKSLRTNHYNQARKIARKLLYQLDVLFMVSRPAGAQ